jgi:predicted small metal-binding protein
MAKQVDCPCGETVRGENDDELVSNVEAHIQDKHAPGDGRLDVARPDPRDGGRELAA